MFTIRSMQLSDLDQVYSIELKAHRVPWSREIISDCMLVGYDCQVLEQEAQQELKKKRIIGYMIARQNLTVYHILNLCVAPTMQGQGLGTYLLHAVINKLQSSSIDNIILEVRPSNQRAIALYQKFGFQQDAIKKNYYQDANAQEDAWLLRKRLR